MTPRYSVVYLSAIDWDFRKQDHQFACLELARRGHRVLYVENTGVRFPGARDLGRVLSRVRNFARRLRADAEDGDLRVASPLVLPAAVGRLERLANRILLRVQLAQGLKWLGSAPIVLWVALPNWAAVDLAKDVDPALLVYYCGEAFGDVPGLRPGIRESEIALLHEAELVFASSPAFAEQCRAEGAEPQLVPIGIDLSVSASATSGPRTMPPELRAARGRLIGYMGGLNHKVDVPLLEGVARAYPKDTVVVLGGVEDPSCVPDAENVLILGERPYDEIGRYLTCFDVCLIPYVVNDFTAKGLPGKLIEYLAYGRPVVSTSLPEVAPYAGVIRVEPTAAGFIRAVGDPLAQPDDPKAREARRRTVAAHAYEAVVAQMIDAVDARMAAITRTTESAT